MRSRRNGTGVGRARICRGSRSHHGAAAYNPGSGGDPEGANRSDPKSAEAVPVRGAVLPLPSHGHILEVRDQSPLRVAGGVQPGRASPPPEIHHQEPAQRPPHRRRPHLLLAPLLRHRSRRQDGAAQPAPQGPPGLIPTDRSVGSVFGLCYGFYLLDLVNSSLCFL